MTLFALPAALIAASILNPGTGFHQIPPVKSKALIQRIADDGTMNHDTMKPVIAGKLEITGTVARATLPNQPVSGGYLTIRNTGNEADRLVGGSASFAGKVEIHEMAIENDIMKMRQLENGLEIPPGGEVVLQPGGLHIMFMQLKEPMKAGEMRKVRLEFEKAGTVELDFMVKMIKPGHMKKMKAE